MWEIHTEREFVNSPLFHLHFNFLTSLSHFQKRILIVSPVMLTCTKQKAKSVLSFFKYLRNKNDLNKISLPYPSQMYILNRIFLQNLMEIGNSPYRTLASGIRFSVLEPKWIIYLIISNQIKLFLMLVLRLQSLEFSSPFVMYRT